MQDPLNDSSHPAGSVGHDRGTPGKELVGARGPGLCERFGFFATRGRKRRSECMKAQRVLEAEGHASLPEARCELRIAKPRLLEVPVPKATDAPADVRRIQDLEIGPARSAEDRAVWNTLMDREHPRGVTTFAAAQMRYLARSAYGYLGAAGFSAAALYLKPGTRGWPGAMSSEAASCTA